MPKKLDRAIEDELKAARQDFNLNSPKGNNPDAPAYVKWGKGEAAEIAQRKAAKEFNKELKKKHGVDAGELGKSWSNFFGDPE